MQSIVEGIGLICLSIFLVWWAAPPPVPWEGQLEVRGMIAGPIIGASLVAATMLLFAP
jgi:hypothetical protein